MLPYSPASPRSTTQSIRRQATLTSSTRQSSGDDFVLVEEYGLDAAGLHEDVLFGIGRNDSPQPVVPADSTSGTRAPKRRLGDLGEELDELIQEEQDKKKRARSNLINPKKEPAHLPVVSVDRSLENGGDKTPTKAPGSPNLQKTEIIEDEEKATASSDNNGPSLEDERDETPTKPTPGTPTQTSQDNDQVKTPASSPQKT